MRKKDQLPPPEGFRYQSDFVPLKEFEFHGYTGKRRVIPFGWHYSFSKSKLKQTTVIPGFLLLLCERAAAFAALKSEDLPHVLITEYGPGATIGWHRDKGVFDEVVGISLLSPCNLRFRRKIGTAWERYSLTMEPRSAYLLRGASRTQWEHSIPGVDSLRYSITFRSLRGKF